MKKYFSLILMLSVCVAVQAADSSSSSSSTGNMMDFGINLLEDQIDEVIFQTNSFLTNSTYVGSQGPFWWIMEICMALAACFSLTIAGSMAYKMMIRHEPLDVAKLIKPLAVAIVMAWWYPPSVTGKGGDGAKGNSYCFLDLLATVPNAVGSYTKVLYEAEADVIQDEMDAVLAKMAVRDTMGNEITGKAKSYNKGIQNGAQETSVQATTDVEQTTQAAVEGQKAEDKAEDTGFLICADKLIMFFGIVLYRFGWWATIYIQQIMLGMLTIFGPLQWAFSLLPKWEGAWAKWITRYLTVHFYGAMLYFVGFYVLLLFDIALTLQLDVLTAGTQDVASFNAVWVGNVLFSTGYFVVAAMVACKCISIVPDLASWMIPEGEVAMGVRSFGEGISQSVKSSVSGIGRRL